MDVAPQHASLVMLLLSGCAAPALAPTAAGNTSEQQAAVAADPAAAAETADASEAETEAETEAEAQAVGDEVVCRYVRRTGSNIHEKQCFTRAELDEMAAQSRDFVRSRGARGGVYSPPDPEDPRSRKKE